MSIEVRCGSCGRRYMLDDRAAGKKGRCKGCGAVLVVPSAAPPVAQIRRVPSAQPPAPVAPDDVYNVAGDAPPVPFSQAPAPLPVTAPAAPQPRWDVVHTRFSPDTLKFIIVAGAALCSSAIGMLITDRWTSDLMMLLIPGLTLVVSAVVLKWPVVKSKSGYEEIGGCLALMGCGMGLFAAGAHFWHNSRGMPTEPQTITLQQLEAKGYGDNAYVHVTGVGVVTGYANGFVGLPLVRADSPLAKPPGTAPAAPGSFRTPPPLAAKEFRVLLKTDSASDESAVRALAELHEFTGVIVNKIDPPNEAQVAMLQRTYDGFDPTKCLILESGRTPDSRLKTYLTLIGGAALALLGFKVTLNVRPTSD